MIDPVTNLTGILNIFVGAIATAVELFFAPFLSVFTPLFQAFGLV